MSGVSGDFSSLSKLKSKLRTYPKTLAHNIAQKAAPALTGLTASAFGAALTVYGDARPAGVQGNALDLEETGTTRQTLKFTATGTVVRCVLGTRYARYLIGKYGILPNGSLPAEWSRALREITTSEAAK